MRRALPTLLASAALAVAQQNPPAESQNPPQQPAQNAPQQPAQNAPQQPAQPAPQQPRTARIPRSPQCPSRQGLRRKAHRVRAADNRNRPLPPAARSFLGKDVPFFDPGSNIASWDGKNWNISNNALFQARFEKFLNAPAATTESDSEYQALLGEIMDKLAPGKITPQIHRRSFPGPGQSLSIPTRFSLVRFHCEPGLLGLALTQEQ